jgi:putative ABC transport system permease protein
MALRNLWKNKRRTLITLASIAFGLLLSLTFTGIGDSGYTKMIDGAAKLGAGHVSVIPTDYLDTPSLDKTIKRTAELTELILGMPAVTACVTRITGQVMVATPKDSVGAAFIAMNPEEETEDTAYILSHLAEGKLFSNDDKLGVIIGRKMAERLSVKLGNKMVYTTTDKSGEITSSLTRVTGIFDTGSDEVDGYMILLPLKRTRQVLGYDADESTELAIYLDDHRKSDRVIETVKNSSVSFDGEVVSWHDTMPDMAGFVAMDSSMNYLFQIIIFILIAAGILNTMLMSVLERTREFGIMMAIGMPPGRLIALIMAEAVWVGIFGLIFGLIVTAPAYGYLHFHGWDISGFFNETTDIAGVVFDTTIYNDLRLSSLIVILAGAFLVTLLSGIYPAWKAGRVQPVESIKTI